MSRSTPSALRASARTRVVHKAASFDEAAAWDRGQHLDMTPDERRAAAQVLKRRAYPADAPDVRTCHETE